MSAERFNQFKARFIPMIANAYFPPDSTTKTTGKVKKSRVPDVEFWSIDPSRSSRDWTDPLRSSRDWTDASEDFLDSGSHVSSSVSTASSEQTPAEIWKQQKNRMEERAVITVDKKRITSEMFKRDLELMRDVDIKDFLVILRNQYVACIEGNGL